MLSRARETKAFLSHQPTISGTQGRKRLATERMMHRRRRRRCGVHALDRTGNMKVLLVNGNTTQTVTERVLAEARRCGAPGTEIMGVTARFGVSIVSTEAENDIAAHAVLDVLAETYA